MNLCDIQEKVKKIFEKKYPGIYSINEITPNIFITSTNNISVENLEVYGVRQILNFGTHYNSDICVNYKLDGKYSPLDLFKLSYDFCDKSKSFIFCFVSRELETVPNCPFASMITGIPTPPVVAPEIPAIKLDA